MTQDASNDPVRTRAFSDTYAQNDMENKHIAKAGYALVNVCTCICKCSTTQQSHTQVNLLVAKKTCQLKGCSMHFNFEYSSCF